MYMQTTYLPELVRKSLKTAKINLDRFWGKQAPDRSQTSINTVLEKPFWSVYRKEIADLQRARLVAYNTTQPNYWQLQDLYKNNVDNDERVGSVKRKRINNILNKKWKFVDANGNENNGSAELFKKKWFRRFMKYKLESLVYGYSFIQFIPDKEHFAKIVLVDRRHCNPSNMHILKSPSDSYGVSLEQMHSLKQPVLVYPIVSEDEELGLLNSLSPLLILKRHSWGNWDDAEQLMSTFIRIAKTSSNDPKARADMEYWLKEMGTAAYGIFPNDADLELKETSRNDFYKVFQEKIREVDDAIAIAFLGQTMTTTDGSSKSQSETHKEVEEELTETDMEEMQMEINDDLIPYLNRYMGLNMPEGVKFSWDQEKRIDLNEKSLADERVSNMLPANRRLSEDYLRKTYGVEFEDVDNFDLRNIPSDLSAKKKVLTKLVDLYKPINSRLKASGPSTNTDDLALKLAEYMAQHNGQLPPKQNDDLNALIEAYEKALLPAITEGFNIDFDTPDNLMLEALTKNVQLFSQAKTYAELVEISSLLVDENGIVRTFSQFKQLVLDLHAKYNLNYLQAEYNLAVLSSQDARNWIDIEQTAKELPILRYITIKDERVRDEHRAMEGITLPYNHSFWKRFYPRNGWGCRCGVIQLPAGTAITPDDKLVMPDMPRLFQNNVGINREIFTKDHPYFDFLPD